MARKDLNTAYLGFEKPNPLVGVQTIEHVYEAASDARRRLMALEGIQRIPFPLAVVAARTAKQWSKRGKLRGLHVAVFAACLAELLAHDPVVGAFLESRGLPSPSSKKRGASR
jgi:hypothetical protein